MLQALESTADQVDRLAEIIDECLTMAEAGVPMSATTRQEYAAEMAELRGQRAQLRKTIADFWGTDQQQTRPVGDGERPRLRSRFLCLFPLAAVRLCVR